MKKKTKAAIAGAAIAATTIAGVAVSTLDHDVDTNKEISEMTVTELKALKKEYESEGKGTTIIVQKINEIQQREESN